MEIAEKYMVRPLADKLAEPKVRPPGSYLSDDSVLEKMFSAKNGEKTKLLWEGDNLEEKSASEGDQSLCNILAFWCGGDREQMDRLFRQSSRMRPKWDEVHGSDTYGNLTMDKAIYFTTEYYKPLGVSSALADFNELVPVLEKLNRNQIHVIKMEIWVREGYLLMYLRISQGMFLNVRCGLYTMEFVGFRMLAL